MARPRGGSDNPVTLFPFLSILACVIGTLVLLITSLAISQIESPPEEELVSRVEEYREIEQAQQQSEQALQEVLPDVQQLEQFRAALAKLQKLLEQLRKQEQEQLRQNNEQRLELDRLLELEKELLALLAEQQKKKKTIEEAIKELREELGRRKMVLEAPTVCVMPAEGGLRAAGNADPVFVEVDAAGVILDPDGKRVRVPTAQLQQDPQFKKTVDAVAGAPNKVLVLLIREDGCNAYRLAEHFARTHDAVVAKLPIVGKGRLDLSRF